MNDNNSERWDDHLPGHVYRQEWHNSRRCWCHDKTAEQIRREQKLQSKYGTDVKR